LNKAKNYQDERDKLITNQKYSEIRKYLNQQ